ncbi:MAG TPA: hypothetical protein VGO92_08705 [Acidimicrobiales bacterium]|nr:hypothetical protein [Acidimicrobiales bacterium]
MSPVVRNQGMTHGPIRMVLDDDTVDRLELAAVRYGLEVEELMMALLQAAASRVDDLLGKPPSKRRRPH